MMLNTINLHINTKEILKPHTQTMKQAHANIIGMY